MPIFMIYGRDASLGQYEAESADLAILACVRDAGYESVGAMEEATGEACDLRAEAVRP